MIEQQIKLSSSIHQLNKNLKLNFLVHIDISPGISFSYILCIVIFYLSKFDEHSSPLLLLGNRQITII